MLKTLGAQLKQYKKDAVITPLLSVLEGILETLIPFVMADIIDKGIAVGDMGAIWKYGAVIVCLALASLTCGVTAGRFSAREKGPRGRVNITGARRDADVYIYGERERREFKAPFSSCSSPSERTRRRASVSPSARASSAHVEARTRGKRFAPDLRQRWRRQSASR